MVCGKEAQYSEIIANQPIRLYRLKFRGGTKMLYHIPPDPPHSFWRVEGGSEFETSNITDGL